MKKVLLIDDDSVTNFINKKLIENSGLAGEIVVAQNGKQGLDILLSSNFNNPLPDVILLDINMPILNGFQFLQRLKELEVDLMQTIKIAILSSSDSSDDIARARSLGITHYYTKPVTLDYIKEIFG
jgi:CheY-like chemotaxis protein